MDVKSLIVKLGFETEHKGLEAVEHKLEQIKERLEFLGAMEVLRGLFEIAEKFSAMGEAIEGAAVSAGITSEAFQKMAYAAAQNGVGQDELQTAMAKLNRQLFEAKKGSESAIKAFADAGIQPETLKSWNNSSEALYGLADAMAGMTDVSARQAVSMELMGRGSFKMVKYLAKGSESMQALEGDAQKMGAVVANEGIEGLAKLENTMTGLWTVVKSFGATVGASFAPSMVTLVKKVEKLWATNEKLVRTRIDEWVYKIAFGMGYAYGVIETVVKVFLRLIETHPRLMTAVLRLIFVLGGLSLAVSVIIGTMAKLRTVASAAWEVMKLFAGHESIFKPFATSIINFALWPIGLFKKGLEAVLMRLALATATAFPAASEAMFAFAVAINATGLPLFAAALALAVALGHDLALWLRGYNVEDMWLYKLCHSVFKLPGALKSAYDWLTGKEGPSEDAPSPVMGRKKGSIVGSVFEDPDIAAAKARDRRKGEGAEEGGEAGSFAKDMLAKMDVGGGAGMMGLLSAIHSNAGPALNSMQGGSLGAGVLSKGAGVLASSEYKMESTTNITIQGHADPKRIDKAVTKAVRDHVDNVHRNAMRAQKQAQVY